MAKAARLEAKPFGPWRNLLWPIHGYELKKVLPMLAMFFFISLVYSLLRNTKDALIVTAPGGGAELIPFLKVYGVIPASVLFMLGFAKLSNHLDRDTLFVAALVPFLVFFASFALLYPVRESIQPTQLLVGLNGSLPAFGVRLAAMLRHWVLSLFYVMSELWGSVALSLLFWGFANSITRVEESRRFYALFGIGANLALVSVKFVNELIHGLDQVLVRRLAMEPWTGYLTVLMAIVLLAIFAIIGIHAYLNQRVLRDPRFALEPGPEPPASKPRLSFLASVRVLWRTRALRYIAILVVAYGIALNLIEVTWKSYLGMQYPDPGKYQDYMSNFAMATGLATIVLMLFVASNVVRRFGWTVAALVTPLVLLVTGFGFFGVILSQGALVAGWITGSPLALGVLFGTVQNVLSKASKYALFDPTKEMAYVPLDPESKVKGKAAIDVVGARLGKAGGSLLQQALIGLYGSLRAVTGQIAALLLVIIGLWIWADLRLGREYARLTREG